MEPGRAFTTWGNVAYNRCNDTRGLKMKAKLRFGATLLSALACCVPAVMAQGDPPPVIEVPTPPPTPVVTPTPAPIPVITPPPPTPVYIQANPAITPLDQRSGLTQQATVNVINNAPKTLTIQTVTPPKIVNVNLLAPTAIVNTQSQPNTTVTNVTPKAATTTVTILEVPSGTKVAPVQSQTQVNNVPTTVGNVTPIAPRRPVPTITIAPSVSYARQSEISSELTELTKQMRYWTDMLITGRSGTNIKIQEFEAKIKSKETELGMYAASNTSLTEAKKQLAGFKVALADAKVKENLGLVDAQLKYVEDLNKLTKDQFRFDFEITSNQLKNREWSLNYLWDVVENQTREASTPDRKTLIDKVIVLNKQFEAAKAKFGNLTAMTTWEARQYDAKDTANNAFNTIKNSATATFNSFMNWFN